MLKPVRDKPTLGSYWKGINVICQKNKVNTVTRIDPLTIKKTPHKQVKESNYYCDRLYPVRVNS